MADTNAKEEEVSNPQKDEDALLEMIMNQAASVYEMSAKKSQVGSRFFFLQFYAI